MKNLFTASALLLAFAAPLASAYSLVSSEVIKGVVESVDLQKREVVVVSNAGFQRVVSFAPDAQIDINLDGASASGLASLNIGREVRIERNILTPTDETIEGVIVSVNTSKRTAKVRQADGKIVKVKFNEGVRVRTPQETLALGDLKRGFEVVVSKVD